MADKFYVQDTGTYVGNSMLWWKYDNCGYVCDIRKARIFTKIEAERICKQVESLKIWPKEFIDARISHHVDRQDMRVVENGKVNKGF